MPRRPSEPSTGRVARRECGVFEPVAHVGENAVGDERAYGIADQSLFLGELVIDS